MNQLSIPASTTLSQGLPGPSPDFPGAERYPLLFSPLKLGRLTVANRWVVPALTTNFAESDGSAGDRIIAYLQARMRGGYGLVMTENIGVHPSGRVMPRMLMASDDSFIPGLRRLVNAVKQEGGVLFGQLSHAGRQTKSSITGMPLVAPSAIPCPLNRQMPLELDEDGIREMEQAFVDAACRLATAGFDGIEIHGAHGYLVGSFLSAYSNKRTDRYGGALENRLRFLLNIVSGIKHELGDDFPISVRISAREFVPEGLDLPEAIEIGKQLRDAGIHTLSVSVGVYESFNRLSMITGEPEGQWLHLAGALREQLAPLPVIGVGRIKRPEVAEQALAAGQIDLAAFGRASIADPDLPRKVLEGKQESIVWCIGCNICLGRSSRPETICPVNPAVGNEYRFNTDRIASPPRIRIVGSSLSALTAAWLAAERGCTVSIDPAGGPVGGMQSWRAAISGQQEYDEAVSSAEHRALSAGVTYSTERPDDDTLIWKVCRYQPVDASWADRHTSVISVYEVLSEEQHVSPDDTVVVVGSDLATAETAIKIASAGCAVRLYVSARQVASDAHPGYREACHRLLLAAGVDLHLESNGPDASSLEWARVFVVGHSGTTAVNDANAWCVPSAVADAYGKRTADATINDAYEPGIMTQGIYDAVNLIDTIKTIAISSNDS